MPAQNYNTDDGMAFTPEAAERLREERDKAVAQAEEVVDLLNEAQDFAKLAEEVLRRLVRVVEDDPDGYWTKTAEVLDEANAFLLAETITVLAPEDDEA